MNRLGTPSLRVRAWKLALVCFAFALVWGGVGCSEEKPGSAGDGAPVAEGTPVAAAEGAPAAGAHEPGEVRLAPGFELVSLSGETVRLADLRGRTVVIDFWATWCPPCEFQVPELNAFYEAHSGDADVTVLGISVDVDGPDVVGGWADEKGVAYQVLLGGEEVAREYGAIGFPTLYIVAPDGTLDSVHVGLIETGELEAALTRQRGAGSS